jgi:hypothetical protein
MPHSPILNMLAAGQASCVIRRCVLSGDIDKVVIGVNFGRESDWLKNIQAAGRCRMRLGGEQLELGAPRLVPVAEGVLGMPWMFGVALRYVVHTADCVELPVVSSAAVEKPASPRP